MVAALREKLPGTEFVVLPESPWFEAWGTRLAHPRRAASTSRRKLGRAGEAAAACRRCSAIADRVRGHRRAAPAGAARRAAGAGRGCGLDHDQGDPARSGDARAWWPRITRAPTAIPWRRRASACGRWPAQVGNRRGRPDRRPPARPGNSSAPTWAPSMSTTRSRPRPPGRRTSTRRWTRSSRSAARTPNTSTCATACRSTTR